MSEKRSKYDTDPLDPDFVRRTEEVSGATRPFSPAAGEPAPEEPTRRFDEQISNSYPSVFVPPAYEPPPRPHAYPHVGQTGTHQPPALSAPPPGPSSPYTPPHSPGAQRTVAGLGLPERVACALPYVPFYIGLVGSIIALLLVPRTETRARFHAAQGLALQMAIIVVSSLFKLVGALTGSGFGGFIFWLASFIFLIVSTIRVYKGEPHHIAPLDEATRLLNERLDPVRK